MTVPGATVRGFAYGEYVNGVPPRSLGYRLQTPVEPEEWTAEVEALARELQAAPYPDDWPQVECFCSVLLKNGQRVIALARYGLSDHTASQRRGGLELIGVVGPADTDAGSALAIYDWLRRRRANETDLRKLGDCTSLAGILGDLLPSSSPRASAVPSSLGGKQGDALLFAARTPADLERRLKLFLEGTAATWQWLPFVGADFPLKTYADRGTLVAWLPYPAKASGRMEQQRSHERSYSQRRYSPLKAAVVCTFLLLLCTNVWAILSLLKRAPVAGELAATPTMTRQDEVKLPTKIEDSSREQFAHALQKLLDKQQATNEWTQNQLLEEYQDLLAGDEHLRVSSPNGQMAVGAVAALSHRGARRVETLVREALAGKGYDPELVNLACFRIRERFAEDLSRKPGR